MRIPAPIWRMGVAAGLLAATALPSGAQPSAAYRVRSATTVLTMDASGRAASLRSREGTELLAGASSPLFVLQLSRAGRATTVRARDAAAVDVRYAGSRTGIVARYHDVGSPGLDATCTVRESKSEALLHWRLSVRIPPGVVLTSVTFPALVLAPRTQGNDAWVCGATKGGLYPRPSGWPIGRSLYAGQPGSLAAAFGCYYDHGGGFTVQARDSRGFPKAIGITHIAEGLLIQWIQSCRAERSWDLGYDIALGTFAGRRGLTTDWRDAADIYKRWALTQPWCRRTLAQRTDLPAWLRAGPAMVRFDRSWLANPASIEQWMSDYWLSHFGRLPLITSYWGWEKVATWVSPDYFPVYPSDEAFAKLAGATRKEGAHLFLWPSGYHYTLTYGKQADGTFRWDDRARFDAIARPHAVVGPDGKTLIGDRTWLEGGQTATMCPGDPWTREWFDNIAAGCARRGAEIVQADQVVGGSFPACYSSSHGHPVGPGPWMSDVFHDQLRTMLAACRKSQSDAVVCFEEPNELFLQQVGIQDYRDWEVVGSTDAEPASVYNYLYHEFVPTFQSNPRQGDLRQAAWCLVNGEMPHLVPSRRFGGGPALDNGGFEEWTAGVPDGWEKVAGWQGKTWTGVCQRDERERTSGSSSARLTNTEPGQTVQVSQNVRVGEGIEVGRRYRLSVSMRTRGVAAGNAVMVAGLAEGLRATSSARIPIPEGTTVWGRAETIIDVPPTTQFVRVMLHLAGPGTLWLDDIHLEEIRADGKTTEALLPAVPVDDAFMRRWVELYHGAGRPYLEMGRMLHPPALQTPSIEQNGRSVPAILHNAFQAPDGAEAVILVNATDMEQHGVLGRVGRVIKLDLKPWEIRLIASREDHSARRPAGAPR